MELFDYQSKILDTATSDAYPRGCILDMEMGLGKTLTSLFIMKKKMRELQPVPRHLLIICKANLIPVWQKELSRVDLTGSVISKKTVLGSSTEGVWLVSIDIVSKILDVLGKVKWDLVILDECTDIKGIAPAAKYTEPIVSMCNNSRYCLLLTGTLVANSSLDVYYPLKCISPDIFGTVQSFYREYFDPRALPDDKPDTKKRPLVSRMGELNEKVSSCRIKLQKRDVAMSLPEKHRELVYLELPPDSLKKTKELRSKLNNLSKNSLQQKQVIMQLVREALNAKFQQVFYWLRLRLRMDNKKMIVFADDVELLNKLSAMLNEDGIKTVVVHSKKNASKKEEVCSEFCEDKSDARVALLGLKCCSKGLNLEKIQYAVFLSLYYVPGEVIQAEDRIHRITSPYDTCYYYYVSGMGTFDEQCLKMLQGKDRTHRKIFDDELDTVFTFNTTSRHYLTSDIRFNLLRVDWSLVNYDVRVGESLLEFIKRSCIECDEIFDCALIQVDGLTRPMALVPCFFHVEKATRESVICIFSPMLR